MFGMLTALPCAGGMVASLTLTAWSGAWSQPADRVYATYGVHNLASDSPCSDPSCIYKRQSDQPTDPYYPAYWSSHWTMYRVFYNYADYPPPYDGAPPPELKPGRDYQISYGATYYDSTWRGPSGEGSMMEQYDEWCLPIFPIANHYSCLFISLGDTAFFLAGNDRPKWMPPICLFSPRNHPPRTDFISHLPYSSSDSARLVNHVQAYSFWIDGTTGKPIQVGVNPDRIKDQAIMFGYAFNSEPTPDRVELSAEPYRHPQSFYFSGYPLAPVNAPIVSQNYTDFAMVKPNPALTWDLVARVDLNTIPKCQLFDPPTRAFDKNLSGKAKTWGDIKSMQR